jgi:hypothetical protein
MKYAGRTQSFETPSTSGNAINLNKVAFNSQLSLDSAQLEQKKAEPLVYSTEISSKYYIMPLILIY